MTETAAGTALSVDRTASPYGSGWGISGVDQVYRPGEQETLGNQEPWSCRPVGPPLPRRQRQGQPRGGQGRRGSGEDSRCCVVALLRCKTCTTILQLAPSGAFNKKGQSGTLYTQARLFIHFYPLEQGPQDLSLLTPIRGPIVKPAFICSATSSTRLNTTRSSSSCLACSVKSLADPPSSLARQLFQPLHAPGSKSRVSISPAV